MLFCGIHLSKNIALLGSQIKRGLYLKVFAHYTDLQFQHLLESICTLMIICILKLERYWIGVESVMFDVNQIYFN